MYEKERMLGGLHALRSGGVPFDGTVVPAISSPVIASWVWAGCAIFLDPMRLKKRKGGDKKATRCIKKPRETE